ncbi:MAG: InlB B-repeat-containing protein, partial [Paludibacteraceae bacterium]|nr:InlB B-repeat-containing protein [Paludibacteraceae bacterium]
NNQQSVNNLTTTNGGIFNLYAKWTANTYKVKFNGNGSTSGSMSDQNFTYGTAQNLTANGFSRTGYTFAGWATSSTGAKAYNNQQSVNNLTATNGGTFNLYAVWSVVNYTISYTLNGGTASNPANYNITTNTFTLNNPTRDGYTFTGWTGSNGSTPQTSVSIEKGSTGNKNYTANWICQAAVDVMNLINAIGTPITLDSKDAIDAARAAYNELTDAQKTEVTNYATLTAAEAAYNTLVADHAAADAVIDKINAIGTPITATSQTAIEEARAAYNALTDTQKGYVTNYSELTDAEAALAVVNLIHAIDNPVVYTAACHDEITDARTAYEALTAAQKALVNATTLQVLTDAEAAYDALEADHNAANAVINLINAIDDPVVYTDACHQEILDAREAYNNLTQAQKDLIDASTLQKLTDAEDAYASLNVAITAKPDPVNDGVYYSTFYDGTRQLQLPANVEAYTATVSGDKMLLKKVAVPGDILPAATAVVLRASQADFTLTPSAASPVSVENNTLHGTDVNMGVPSDHCYVLSGADGFVGFYPLSAPYTLTAHKAYIDLDNLPGGANNAPRRLRFVFSEEQTATGMENVQGDNVQSTKVLENGVLYIIKNGVRYNAQGQIVK